MVNRQLALFLGNDLFVLTVPRYFHSMSSHDLARLAGKQLLMRLVSAAGAVPGVGLLAVVVADLVEAEKNAPVVRVEAARSLGQEAFARGIKDVMVDLVAQVALFLGGVIEWQMHIAKDW